MISATSQLPTISITFRERIKHTSVASVDHLGKSGRRASPFVVFSGPISRYKLILHPDRGPQNNLQTEFTSQVFRPGANFGIMATTEIA